MVEFYKDNAGYCDAKDQIVAQLSRYFAPGGTRSNVFREPVGIDKIRDARVVICSFGLAGKTEKTIDPIQLALTQLYAADIMGLRSIFMQAKGKYCIKLWEEFQRWGSLPDSDKTISTALTGGRKLGDVNIIITNKVSELLQTDRFGIFESTTSFAIGAINDSKIRHELAERLNIERLIPDLDRLAKDSESKDMNALYRYAFVVHPKKGEETVTKMQLPADIADSPLFRTGVKVSGGEGGDGALAEFIPFEVVDKLTDLAVDVCYDWYDSGTKEISKEVFHKDLESDALFYGMHEALASTPSGLELTEAFGKIDGVVWRYIKDLLTMGICTVSNGMPVDFTRESLIIEFQNRLNDAILDV